MKPKWMALFIMTMILGTCVVHQPVYSEELSSGVELEEFLVSDINTEILSAGDGEGETETENTQQTDIPSDPSEMPDYWAGSDGPYIQTEEGSVFQIGVVIPEEGELSFVIEDESIISIEGSEHFESEVGGEYVTRLSLKGLKAGNTYIHVLDGETDIWTFEIAVSALPVRDPYIADINDTTVSGITDLILKPGVYCPITVTGAGTENTEPVSGDTRWVPIYWKEENGTDLHTTFAIGSIEGINDIRTIPLIIYLQEQRYDAETGDWEATGSVEFITAKATTSAYYDPYQLQQPTLIAAYNGAKGIGIKFYKEDLALEYVIYRKFNGVWSRIYTVKANDPELQISGETIMYTDTSVAADYGKGYIYSVAAKREEYITGYDTKGAAIYRLTPPALTTITNSEAGTAVVSWKGVFGSTETNGAYDLQYAEYKDGKAGEFISVIARPGYGHQTLSAVVSGLKKGSRYVFRIRCSKTNKDRGTYYSEYSKWLSVTIDK